MGGGWAGGAGWIRGGRVAALYKLLDSLKLGHESQVVAPRQFLEVPIDSPFHTLFNSSPTFSFGRPFLSPSSKVGLNPTLPIYIWKEKIVLILG